MRRFVIAVLMSCLLVTGTAIHCHAQKYKGEVVINTNTAFSLMSSFIRISFRVADYDIKGLNTKVLPALSGTADIGVTDRISIGVGYVNQVAKATLASYTDTVADTTYLTDFKFRASRNNFGVRVLLHFGNNDQIDPYFGFRVGYGEWNVTSTETIFELYDQRKFKNIVTVQAVFGARYYFLPYLGVNGEMAFGFPYFLSAGLSWKFGGMKYTD